MVSIACAMFRESLSVHKRPEPAILQGDNWLSQLPFCWLAHKRLSIKPIPIAVTHLDFMSDVPQPMFFIQSCRAFLKQPVMKWPTDNRRLFRGCSIPHCL